VSIARVTSGSNQRAILDGRGVGPRVGVAFTGRTLMSQSRRHDAALRLC